MYREKEIKIKQNKMSEFQLKTKYETLTVDEVWTSEDGREHGLLTVEMERGRSGERLTMHLDKNELGALLEHLQQQYNKMTN